MIMGMSANQSFCFVFSIVFGGIFASAFKGTNYTVFAWFMLVLFLGVEFVTFKIVNTQRRALIYHYFVRTRSLCGLTRYSGRGSSAAWSKNPSVGGERKF